MSDEIFRQIMAIRDTGRVNMFDVPAVQRMAFESGFASTNWSASSRSIEKRTYTSF